MSTPPEAGLNGLLGRLAAGLFVAAAAGLYALPDLAPAHLGSAYIALHLVMTLAMLTAWFAGVSWRWALGAGLLARLALIALDPFTSNDTQRYLWDGAVLLQGHDPYLVHPDHPQVAQLRQVWPTPPEHGAYPTLYPPAALALFAACASLGPLWAPLAWKALAGAAGIGSLLLGLDLLARRGQLRHAPLLALSPLLVLETGAGGHLDAFTLLAITLALWAHEQRRFGLVGAALGLGTAIKLLPALALVPLLIAAPGAAARMRLLLAAGVVLALAYGAALAAGLQPIGSLPVFFEKWRNGAPIYLLLEPILHPQALRVVLAGLALGLLTLAAATARRHIFTAVALALAAPLAISPVVFPWYLQIFAPLAALAPSAALLAWMSLAPLSYEVVDGFATTGAWQPADWPLWTLGVGVAAGLCVDAWRARLRK